MSKNTNFKRGFTLVELLIVIVVIAILAAISIVAYNGIQDRARNTTAKETGSQLRTKIEAYNSVQGAYPAPSEATVNGLATVLDTVEESKLDTAIQEKMVGPSDAVTADKPVKYQPCTTTPANGGTVTIWQKTTTETLTLGTC